MPALDKTSFFDPPGEFRPEPFWGLNDALNEAELRRQIGAMVEGGWGGFFLHARHGLETAYLSDAYMEFLSTIVKEAGDRGLRAWLYDEHPFPSGAAGGLVGAGQRALRHSVLAANLHTRLTPVEEGVAYFEIETDARTGVPTRAVRVADPTRAQSGNNRFLHFYTWEMPVARTDLANHGNPFLHGFPFTDLLNPVAVARFIELTYERHKDWLGDRFGTTVAGAFSDIPVYNWHYATPHPSVPWTAALPEHFRRRYGYDLTDVLPSLLYDLDDYLAVRHDFWQLASDLFVESYTQQIAQWCRDNGIRYSAHYWGEEALHWQVAWAGDVMHHFSHQDVVANDHIVRNIDDPIGIKQAATVAEQLGKERTLTEIYALCGHNLTFEERKWIGEWAFVLGSNMLVPYIPQYSLRGRRKRDEPPSEFVQQPYWPQERMLNDYFGRLAYALTCGERVVDVLLLQPLSSVWVLYRPPAEIPPAWRPGPDPFEGAGSELFDLSDGFRAAVDWLLAAHRDFHLGNERILAEHGSVVGNRLRVGRASYDVVVVPPSVTWEASTVDLLQQFGEAGGRVIVVGAETPSSIGGRPSQRPVLPPTAEVVDRDEGAFVAALGGPSTRGVRIAAAPAVLYQHRVDDETGSAIFFFVNTSIEHKYDDVAIELVGVPASAVVESWNLVDGTTEQLESAAVADGLMVELDFAPAGSHLLIARTDATALGCPRSEGRSSSRIDLESRWTFRLDGPNALVLDYCRLRVGDGEWSERLPVWQVHQRLRRAGIGVSFSARFEASIAEVPERVSVAVESVERYDLTVNGEAVAVGDATVWFDQSLTAVDIARHVKHGPNLVELSGRVGLDTEFEPIYLTGDFSVALDGNAHSVGAPATVVDGRDLTREGYPFLVGRPVLTQSVVLPHDIARAVLELDRLDAVVARVRVNGEDCGALGWRPFSLDVTHATRPGENVVEIELATSLHNLFGPHHDRRGEVRHYVIDGVWENESEWTDDYFVVPVGVDGVSIAVETA